MFFVFTDPKQIEEIESLSLDLIDELYEGYHSELANVSINVKASIGIAFFPEHGDDSNKVVAAADEAMYFVKKNGKANYHIYQPEDSRDGRSSAHIVIKVIRNIHTRFFSGYDCFYL